MIKKGLLVSTAALIALASGCSSKQEPAAADTGKTAQQQAVSNEPVELVLYSTAATSEEEVQKKFIDPVKQKFPNITIKYIKKGTGTTIDEMVASGQTIDIYYESTNYFYTVSNYDLAYDMTDLIKKHNIDLSAFEPTMIDFAKSMSKNGIYGLPVWSQNVILFYNKDIFDKFGVPYPKNGMTWDELQQTAKTLTRTDGDKQYLGFASSPAHTIKANQLGLTFLDPKTDKATIQTDEKWKQLYQTYYVNPSNDPNYKKAMVALKNKLPYKDPFLKDRNLAMMAYLSDLDWANSGSEGMNWDIAALPSFKDMPTIGSQAYPFYWGVTKQSKYKDQAMQVIQYLTSVEYQTKQVRSGTMTALKDDAIKKQFAQDSKYKDKNTSAVFYHQYAPMPARSPYEGDAQKAYEDAIHEAALGDTDLNTLFRKIEETANKAVDAAKAKTK
ncbi:ABC transporter substrate-binding protein [Paenibacillus sp. NPDC056579]|uniref:ABC transporter substrate-binding protein n=1 Tax=unclassified Paenibacillus TaxID=185978 RepID=UPI001EF958EF|nr:extracellular solute-binding protein [Paenibacillus sp. H1-7]ULL15339.1 extracellular solute-binding protein [Paenibacillus sp. H1-7]